ncbi:2-phospho-L-lactate guanylyltransferase [Demequina sp. SYSU T00192]|uniref:Phosphoenolpyruvate guanylyltransferase n=1 Tax=Demequina litoralis TaxID=3051660 RepID=A0ABT8G838_9MICO|nr:2-phospho-L-lactate guanylyltransferase [Demequina sp. SYSU T00192]MDN4475304.1 2-phospho-L-lactate guanylyltransferase [Demequina sp. SYSU T00192]
MTRWTVIVPVKGGTRAKSRLPETLGGASRGMLAAALTADTLAAVAGTASVARILVVSSVADLDPAWLGDVGPRALVVRQASGAGLNAAVRHAAGMVSGRVAVVLGDLPSLRPGDLAAVLGVAERHPRGMVADAEGHGTTMLTTLGDPLAVSFGPRSAARHRRAGHVEIPAPLRARADVDTVEDLARARTLGVGPRTAAALGLPVPHPAAGSAIAAAVSRAG